MKKEIRYVAKRKETEKNKEDEKKTIKSRTLMQTLKDMFDSLIKPESSIEKGYGIKETIINSYLIIAISTFIFLLITFLSSFNFSTMIPGIIFSLITVAIYSFITLLGITLISSGLWFFASLFDVKIDFEKQTIGIINIITPLFILSLVISIFAQVMLEISILNLILFLYLVYSVIEIIKKVGGVSWIKAFLVVIIPIILLIILYIFLYFLTAINLMTY